MNTVPASGEVTSGYDCSKYQSVSIHSEMKAKGAKFCFIKASEGTSEDVSFIGHRTTASSLGIVNGPYHFYHPSMDPVKQAEFFCGVFGKLGGNDLSPVMDWETTDGVASVNDRENGYSFLNSVEQLSGRTPIIYGSPYFLEALSLDSRFLRFPLWTAHYGVKAPLVPAPWTTWSFWQYSGTGAVDLDYYTGIFPLFVNAEPLINNLAPLEGLKPVIPVVL